MGSLAPSVFKALQDDIRRPGFFSKVALGDIPNYSYVNLCGRNDRIQDNGNYADIWNEQGDLEYLAAAEIHEVMSTSGQDNATGNGVQSVRVVGLLSTFLQAEETIITAGGTNVPTVNSYIRILDFKGLDVGSNGANVGEVRIDPVVSGAGARQAILDSDEGKVLSSHYTIPDNKIGLVWGYTPLVAAREGNTGVKEAKIRFYTRTDATQSWNVLSKVGIRSDACGLPVLFDVPFVLTPRTDIRFAAASESNNTSVAVNYTILMEDL